MADEGMDDPRLVAEGELSLARLALDDDEPAHAADHLANALAVAPTLPEAHALLAVLAGHPGGGAGLWSLDGEVYVGAAVARACQRQYAAGLGLLLSAQGHEPASPWADVAWVVDPDVPAKVDPDELVQVFAQLIGIVPEPCPRSRWATRAGRRVARTRRWPRWSVRSPTVRPTSRCTPTSPGCWARPAGSTRRSPGPNGRSTSTRRTTAR